MALSWLEDVTDVSDRQQSQGVTEKTPTNVHFLLKVTFFIGLLSCCSSPSFSVCILSCSPLPMAMAGICWDCLVCLLDSFLADSVSQDALACAVCWI